MLAERCLAEQFLQGRAARLPSQSPPPQDQTNSSTAAKAHTLNASKTQKCAAFFSCCNCAVCALLVLQFIVQHLVGAACSRAFWQADHASLHCCAACSSRCMCTRCSANRQRFELQTKFSYVSCIRHLPVCRPCGAAIEWCWCGYSIILQILCGKHRF